MYNAVQSYAKYRFLGLCVAGLMRQVAKRDHSPDHYDGLKADHSGHPFDCLVFGFRYFGPNTANLGSKFGPDFADGQPKIGFSGHVRLNGVGNRRGGTLGILRRKMRVVPKGPRQLQCIDHALGHVHLPFTAEII